MPPHAHACHTPATHIYTMADPATPHQCCDGCIDLAMRQHTHHSRSSARTHLLFTMKDRMVVDPEGSINDAYNRRKAIATGRPHAVDSPKPMEYTGRHVQPKETRKLDIPFAAYQVVPSSFLAQILNQSRRLQRDYNSYRHVVDVVEREHSRPQMLHDIIDTALTVMAGCTDTMIAIRILPYADVEVTLADMEQAALAFREDGARLRISQPHELPCTTWVIQVAAEPTYAERIAALEHQVAHLAQFIARYG